MLAVGCIISGVSHVQMNTNRLGSMFFQNLHKPQYFLRNISKSSGFVRLILFGHVHVLNANGNTLGQIPKLLPYERRNFMQNSVRRCINRDFGNMQCYPVHRCIGTKCCKLIPLRKLQRILIPGGDFRSVNGVSPPAARHCRNSGRMVF